MSLWYKKQISYDETNWDEECALLTCNKLIREDLVVPQSYLWNIVWSEVTKYVLKKAQHSNIKTHEQKKIRFLECPSQSPDLNMIEIFRHDLKRAIHAMHHKNITELQQFCKTLAVVQVWCAITGNIWWWRLVLLPMEVKQVYIPRVHILFLQKFRFTALSGKIFLYGLLIVFTEAGQPVIKSFPTLHCRLCSIYTWKTH